MFDNRIENNVITNNAKVYAKNSFDRFGDDLTEELLQYLTLENKIRLECVSKQWQRCVFNKQFVLDTSYLRYRSGLWNSMMKVIKSKRQREVQIIESIVKKCPNITDVILWSGINSSVLSLIGRYCPRIKSFEYTVYDKSLDFFRINGQKLGELYLYKEGDEFKIYGPNIKSLSYHSNIGSDDNVLSFFRIYGHKLEELNISGDIDEIINIITFCPNLKKVFIPNFLFLLTENKEFLPKLEKIISIIEIFPDNRINRVKQMKILSDKYRQTMKTLNVGLTGLTAEELKTCIECIARFENLKELRLDIKGLNISEPIDHVFKLIGRKCTKLLKFKLRIYESLLIFDRFFDLFYDFKAIKKLLIILPHNSVYFVSNTVLSGSVECFKNCKQLIELDIDYPELREDFFVNIDTFVPKLQSLRIQTDKQFSDSFIELFLFNKYMKNIFLTFYFSEKRDSDYNHKSWSFNKCLSDVRTSRKLKDVILVTDNWNNFSYKY